MFGWIGTLFGALFPRSREPDAEDEPEARRRWGTCSRRNRPQAVDERNQASSVDDGWSQSWDNYRNHNYYDDYYQGHRHYNDWGSFSPHSPYQYNYADRQYGSSPNSYSPYQSWNTQQYPPGLDHAEWPDNGSNADGETDFSSHSSEAAAGPLVRFADEAGSRGRRAQSPPVRRSVLAPNQSMTASRADVLDWDALRRIVPKENLTAIDRETLKKISRPPMLRAYSSWREYKQAVFHWAAQLLRVGYEEAGLWEELSTVSISQDIPQKHMEIVQKLKSSTTSSSIVDRMKSADEQLGAFVRTTIQRIEQKLKEAGRNSGQSCSGFCNRLNYFFAREQETLATARTEASKVEVLISGLRVMPIQEQLIRAQLGERYSLEYAVMVIDSLSIGDTKTYDPFGGEKKHKESALEDLILFLDSPHEQGSAQANSGRSHYTTGENNDKRGGGGKGDGKGRKDKGKTKGGKSDYGGKSDKGDDRNCRFGPYCRNYLDDRCPFTHAVKDKQILDRLKESRAASGSNAGQAIPSTVPTAGRSHRSQGNVDVEGEEDEPVQG
jgi:hypothetical protein